MLVLLPSLSLAGLQAAEVGDDIPQIARREDAEHGGLMKTHQLFFCAL